LSIPIGDMKKLQKKSLREKKEGKYKKKINRILRIKKKER